MMKVKYIMNMNTFYAIWETDHSGERQQECTRLTDRKQQSVPSVPIAT